jgi:DNA polymerase IIIc chi subunit
MVSIMSQMNFYCVDSDSATFLYNFLGQLLSRFKKKILLYSTSAEKLKKLDDFLWKAGGRTGFLPHSIYPGSMEHQTHEKLLLTSRRQNFNRADYLIISSFVDDKNFLKNFHQIFYICGKVGSETFQQAKINAQKYAALGYSITVNIKDSSGNIWIVQNSFD